MISLNTQTSSAKIEQKKCGIIFILLSFDSIDSLLAPLNVTLSEMFCKLKSVHT